MAGIGGASSIPGSMEPGGVLSASVTANTAFARIVASQVTASQIDRTLGNNGSGILWEFIGKTSVTADLVMLKNAVGRNLPRFFDMGERAVMFVLSAQSVELADAVSLQARVNASPLNLTTELLHGTSGTVTGFPIHVDRQQIEGALQENLTLTLLVAEPYVFEFLVKIETTAPVIHAKFISVDGSPPAADQFLQVIGADRTVVGTAKFVPQSVTLAFEALAKKFPAGQATVVANNGTSFTGACIRVSRQTLEGTANEDLSVTLLIPFPF